MRWLVLLTITMRRFVKKLHNFVHLAVVRKPFLGTGSMNPKPNQSMTTRASGLCMTDTGLSWFSILSISWSNVTSYFITLTFTSTFGSVVMATAAAAFFLLGLLRAVLVLVEEEVEGTSYSEVDAGTCLSLFLLVGRAVLTSRRDGSIGTIGIFTSNGGGTVCTFWSLSFSPYSVLTFCRDTGSCLLFPAVGRDTGSCLLFPAVGKDTGSCLPFSAVGRDTGSCLLFPAVGKDTGSCLLFSAVAGWETSWLSSDVSLFPVYY